MFVECIIANIFSTIKTILPEFKYLEVPPNSPVSTLAELWSPSLEYDTRLASFIVKTDVHQQLELNDWIGFVWTFSVLNTPSALGRNMIVTSKDIDNLIGNKYHFVKKEIQYDLGVFSKDGYNLIHFMEQFAIMFDREYTLNVLYPSPYKEQGTFSQSLYDIAINDFTIIDTETRGSLVKLGVNFKTIVPLIRLKSTTKLIGSYPDIYDPMKIHAKININSNIPDSTLFEYANQGFFIL